MESGVDTPRGIVVVIIHSGAIQATAEALGARGYWGAWRWGAADGLPIHIAVKMSEEEASTGGGYAPPLPACPMPSFLLSNYALAHRQRHLQQSYTNRNI